MRRPERRRRRGDASAGVRLGSFGSSLAAVEAKQDDALGFSLTAGSAILVIARTQPLVPLFLLVVCVLLAPIDATVGGFCLHVPGKKASSSSAFGAPPPLSRVPILYCRIPGPPICCFGIGGPVRKRGGASAAYEAFVVSSGDTALLAAAVAADDGESRFGELEEVVVEEEEEEEDQKKEEEEENEEEIKQDSDDNDNDKTEEEGDHDNLGKKLGGSKKGDKENDDAEPNTAHSSAPLPSMAEAVVVGAGPAGLLSAIMLAEKTTIGLSSSSSLSYSSKIYVFDRQPNPPPSPKDDDAWKDAAKFYLIGLGHRGQNALNAFQVWDNVVSTHCVPVPGRMDWSPGSTSLDYNGGTIRIFNDRPAITQVIPREKLVGCMYEYIKDNFRDRIDVRYGYDVQPIDFGCGDGWDDGRRRDETKREGEDAPPVRLRVVPSRSRRRVSADLTDDDISGDDNENDNDNEYDNDDVNANTNDDNIAQCESIKLFTNLLVAADGTARTVASAIEKDDNDDDDDHKRSFRMKTKTQGHGTSSFLQWLSLQLRTKWRKSRRQPFKVTRYVDDNRRVYKTIPLQLPKTWRTDLNYSSRSKDGRVTFDALPADSNGKYCGVLLLRKDDSVLSNPEKEGLRELLDEYLPQFSRMLDDDALEVVSTKKPSFLPSFRYAGPRLYHGERTVLLGDCAHTVKPYFGLGANTALEDVQVLGEAIDTTTNIGDALRIYSSKRAKEAEVLVKLSRGLDRPGTLGTLAFVIPLIIDSIFHKVAPRFFAPNTLAMFQREGVSFVGIRRRKRIDRFMQISILGAASYGMWKGVTMASRVVWMRAMDGGSISASGVVVAGAIVALATVGEILRRVGFLLVPGLAPADVMPKTEEKM